MTDAYDAAIDRALQSVAEEVDLPVEFLRAAPTSGDWLRMRADVVEAFTQPHRERAARFVGAMQEAIERAFAGDESVEWTTVSPQSPAAT